MRRWTKASRRSRQLKDNSRYPALARSTAGRIGRARLEQGRGVQQQRCESDEASLDIRPHSPHIQRYVEAERSTDRASVRNCQRISSASPRYLSLSRAPTQHPYSRATSSQGSRSRLRFRPRLAFERRLARTKVKGLWRLNMRARTHLQSPGVS